MTPETPDCIIRAFAKVKCQIVRIWSDGSESIINMTNLEKAWSELPKYRARIGMIDPVFNRTMLDVIIRRVEA